MTRPSARDMDGYAWAELPFLAQGTTRTGGPDVKNAERDRQRIEVLRLGIEMGMNLVDTAELYGGGHAEEIVGEAIKEIRQQVFLASKFNPGHSAYQEVLRAADNSLRRLRTDYLDLYQMHWPNPRVPIDETLGAMRELVKQGKVRFLGLSNVTLGEIKTARATTMPPDIVFSQVEYNLFQRTVEQDVIPYCQHEGMTVLAYSPLDRGSVLQKGPRLQLLLSLAKKYQKTVAQITLRWMLSRPSVIPVVKSASREHILENAKVRTFDLLDEDLDEIDSTFKQTSIRVPPYRIRAQGTEATGLYQSVEEALGNELDLVPAPESVARNIEEGNFLKPIPLTPTSDPTGVYDYDLADNGILYWAWVIAKGDEEPILAFEK